MASFLRIALPIAAIAGAAFTGGASLSLLGADAAAETGGAIAAESIGGAIASGATEAGLADAATTTALSSFGTATGEAIAGEASTASQIGSFVSSVSPYVRGASAIGQIGGTILQVEGANQQAKAVQNQANYTSDQLKVNASNDMAAAEQTEQQQNLQNNYVLSKAQAISAASGGSATDPTAVTNMKTIAGVGRYRALTDMYNGQAKATADMNQAAATQYGASLASQADTTRSYGSILSGASSLFDKYGSLDDNSKTKYGY